MIQMIIFSKLLQKYNRSIICPLISNIYLKHFSKFLSFIEIYAHFRLLLLPKKLICLLIKEFFPSIFNRSMKKKKKNQGLYQNQGNVMEENLA